MPKNLQLTKAYHRQVTKQGKLKQAARNFRRLNNELAVRIGLLQPGVR